jgi:hypothetical protein
MTRRPPEALVPGHPAAPADNDRRGPQRVRPGLPAGTA